MGVINLLNKSVSELIAAGEVIERPASVVKELVENSIDAGATKIKIEIKDGGVTYINITDNGCGIFKDDVKKAFLRHATSKVHNVDDINNILTLGFRGEALASICAVSKVELITRTKDELDGTKYIVVENKGGVIEDAGSPVGTSITIKDLFFNVPARMKFLKKDVTEGNAIASIIDKLALSHPEIAFTFIREGQEKLSTCGDGNLLSAIYCVLGKDLAAKMLPLEYGNNNITIKGYISNPAESKTSRSMQHFFVNSRYVKSKTCSGALEDAYKSFIIQGRFPACVLNITIPANAIDVNVHPSKLEVRFANESLIYNLVYAGVKNCILSNSYNPVMHLKNNYESKQIVSTIKNNNTLIEKLDYIEKQSLEPIKNLEKKEIQFSSYKPNFYNNKNNLNNDYTDSSLSDFKNLVEEVAKTAKKLENEINEKEIKQNKINEKEPTIQVVDNVVCENNCNIDENVKNKSECKAEDIVLQKELFKVESTSKFIGEVFKTYIIIEKGNDIIFIDKHAAHERIIYEKIKNGRTKNERQVMLTPEVINLGLTEYQLVIDNIEVFENIGFLVEDFGEKAVIVREIPIILDGFNIADIINDIITDMIRCKNNVTSKVIDNLYYTVACKAAIKAGDKTDKIELEELVNTLENNLNLKNCPHGRPIFFTIKKRDIEKQFLR